MLRDEELGGRISNNRSGWIEVDTQPQKLFHMARDWGELLITRQLVEPLFIELPERGISTNIFQRVNRIDHSTWALKIRDDTRWSDGSPVTAHQVCEQIQRAHRSRGAASTCTALISQLEIRGHDAFVLRTRFPMGDVRRLLTCPALGPAIPGQRISSGNTSLANDL